MPECNINEPNLANSLKNLKYDLKQNLITSGSAPTLKYIALNRVSICLWHAYLQGTNLNHLKGKFSFKNVKNYEKQILDCFPQLLIPNCLKFDLAPIISSIGIELSNYFRYQVYFYEFITTKKLKIYLNNLCWNHQQGTINIVKTGRKIIDQTDLNIEDKYILACNLCQEDKVTDLREILPISVIHYFEENSEPFSLPVFWSSYIKKKEFPRMIKGVPALEYILRFVNATINEAAVHYFLDNFSSEAQKERLVGISHSIFERDIDIKNCDNILLYFCMQLNQNQLVMLPLKIQCKLLRKLHSFPKWYNSVPVSTYVKELIESKNVTVAFKIISFCWKANILDLKEDVHVWNNFVLRFKPEIELQFLEIFDIHLDNFCKIKCMDILELLLSIATTENKRQIISFDETMEYCVWLIGHKGLECFDKFMNLALNSDEISQFQNEFFQDQGLQLSRMLVVDYPNYDVLDQVMLKFCSDENRVEYKKKITLFLVSIIKQSMKRNMNLLLCINKFISWCFEGNEEEIARFKAIAFDLDSESDTSVKRIFFYAVKKLIKRRKWKPVKKCWKWIFHISEKRLTTSEEKLNRIKKIICSSYAEQCWVNYMRIKNCHELLKIFIISCFNKNEVKDLKEELWRNGDLSFIVTELLKRKKFSKADFFLDWCFSSDSNKIADFRTRFINF